MMVGVGEQVTVVVVVLHLGHVLWREEVGRGGGEGEE